MLLYYHVSDGISRLNGSDDLLNLEEERKKIKNKQKLIEEEVIICIALFLLTTNLGSNLSNSSKYLIPFARSS